MAAPGTIPTVTGLGLRGGVALIVGAGPGLGEALATRFASAGMSVALAARNGSRLSTVVEHLQTLGGATYRAYPCDATSEPMVEKLIEAVTRDMGPPDIMVYAVQDSALDGAMEIQVEALERYWRHLCLGAFICCRQAAFKMLPLARGTLVLLGSTSSIVGRPKHLNLAVGKFGLRALAQVFARELSPLGIHVVHVVIDADVREPRNSHETAPQALPEDIADLVVSLHRQPRSAWTHEVDVRPWNEAFWEHC